MNNLECQPSTTSSKAFNMEQERITGNAFIHDYEKYSPIWNYSINH